MSESSRQTNGLTQRRSVFGCIGRAVDAVVGTVFAAIGLIWLISVSGVIWFSVRDVRTPGAAIVVLGAAQYAGRPSPVLKARLDHAIDLWRADTTRFIVFTGGMGSGDTTSEAVVGAKYAKKQGVPDRLILMETEGRTTSESVHALAVLLRPHNISSLVLVSDPFHMFRLWILARKEGFSVVTSPTRTSPIASRSVRNIGYIFSESLKAPIAFLID